MKVPNLRKIITGPARKRTMDAKVLLRKKLNQQRARTKKAEQLRPIIQKGEKAAMQVKAKGVNNLSLAELKAIEEALHLEITHFDKELAVALGGHFG